MKTLTKILEITLPVIFVCCIGVAAFSFTHNPEELSDKEYIDKALAMGIDLSAEELTNYQDTTVRFILTAGPLDTLGFTFPSREIVTKRFKFVTVQEDIDSLKNNPIFNTLMMKSRAGHNFWFNN